MKTLNPDTIARIAGVLYLLLIPLGIMGILFVPQFLIVPDDITTTIDNIIENQLFFSISILSALTVQLVNVAVVLLLYKLFKPVNKTIASTMVIALLLGVPVAFLNELNHGAVLLLLNNAGESIDLISLFLNLHEYGVFTAQIFWGLWLFPMGYLAYQSGFIPKIIGIMLMIGCFGYLADSIVFLLNLNFNFIFSEFTFLGEVALPLWLLLKGIKKT